MAVSHKDEQTMQTPILERGILITSHLQPTVFSPTTGLKEATFSTEDTDTDLRASVAPPPLALVSRQTTQVPASFIESSEPVVTKREQWSFYSYYSGANSIGPYWYALAFFQSLATTAGFDPIKGPGSSCLSPDASGRCVVPWAGKTKEVSSVVLLANGASFAVMSLLFTGLGSAADYGTVGRWSFLIVTCICWASQFGFLAVTSPSLWGVAMALFMIGFISYGGTQVFYGAILPRLARNTARSRLLWEKYQVRTITFAQYETEMSMEKNRLSNMSTAWANIGWVMAAFVALAVLFPLGNNTRAKALVLVFMNIYWIVVGIWWFIFQQPRPGRPLPEGEIYLLLGWKRLWWAAAECKKLPHTVMYLIGLSLLADGFNTTSTLIQICQNDKFSFNFLHITYLNLIQAVTSVISTLGYWYIQRHWKIPTKTMLTITNVATVMMPLWGMIGIWTTKVGFHNVWEFWVYNVIFGLFQAPYYAFSWTMMAELTPPGFDNMFFGLYSLSYRGASLIGPLVIQAIIDRSGSNWKAFPFLFALCFCASLVVWLVDVPRGQRDAIAWGAEAKLREDGLGETERPSEKGH